MSQRPPPTRPAPSFDFADGSETIVLAKRIRSIDWARARIVTRIHGERAVVSSGGERDGASGISVEVIVKD